MITLTLLLLFGIFAILGKLLMFVLPVAWGGIRIIGYILFLPFTILLLLATGLFHLLLPLMVLGAVIMLITHALENA